MTIPSTMRLLFTLCLLPMIASAQTRVVTDVAFVPNGDTKQLLDIYAPNKATKAPVIISLYGGALRAGDKSGEVFVGKRLSERGFVTVVPNYRLSPSVMHPAHVEDAAAAVAWVRNNIARYGGDSTSIVVIGHSAGAYLAALLTTDAKYLGAHRMMSSELRGVVPVSAFFYVDRPDVAVTRPKDVWGTDAMVWKDASPGAHVGRGLPPMLLLYADGDDAWRREQQPEFMNAVKAADNPSVSMRMIPARTHGSIWSKMTDAQDETLNAIVGFVNALPRR